MGKRRSLWILWLIAAALLWFFENGAATLAILAASLLLPAASILAARSRAGKLRLALKTPPAAAKGQPLRIALSAEGVPFFCRVTGELRGANRLTGEETEAGFLIGPRLSGRAELSVAANTGHCGVLRLNAEAWTEDLFGLWRSAPLPCQEEFVLLEPKLFLPTVTLEENTTVITEGERYSQRRPGSDPSETFSIREYIPGDPIRQIHWKLSEKSDALLLRELGLPVVNRTLLVFRNVLVSGETVQPEQADAMAEVFLSVSRALMSDGLVHTAAFAEHGRYMLTEVQNEADYQGMAARFLSLSWEAEDGALGRLLAETPYAHVAVVSAVLPPDAEDYCRGNRVSVLTCAECGEAPGVFVVPFRAEGYPEDLRYIEV